MPVFRVIVLRTETHVFDAPTADHAARLALDRPPDASLAHVVEVMEVPREAPVTERED